MTIEALIAEWKAWMDNPEQIPQSHAEFDGLLCATVKIGRPIGEDEKDLASLLGFIAGYRAAEKAKVPQ